MSRFCFRVVHTLTNNFRNATIVVTKQLNLPIKQNHVVVKIIYAGVNASDVSVEVSKPFIYIFWSWKTTLALDLGMFFRFIWHGLSNRWISVLVVTLVAATKTCFHVFHLMLVLRWIFFQLINYYLHSDMIAFQPSTNILLIFESNSQGFRIWKLK